MRFDVLPSLFAHYVGALLGVLTGVKLVAEFLLLDLKQLASPSGRKEVIYGSRGASAPVTFEDGEAFVASHLLKTSIGC